jgi:hypothetical protein
MPGAQCTRSLAWEKQNHTSKSPQVHRIGPAFPHANGFNGFLRSLPGEPGLLTPSSAGCASIDADLIPASGYRDATTSPSAIKRIRLKRCSRPPHPAPTLVTIAKRPSCVGRDGEGYAADLRNRAMRRSATNWHDGQITCRAQNRVNRNFLLSRTRCSTERCSAEPRRSFKPWTPDQQRTAEALRSIRGTQHHNPSLRGASETGERGIRRVSSNIGRN